MKSCFSLFLICLLGSSLLWAQNPAQKRLMAKRAAQLDGYRQLAEQVKGLRISSSTTVKDFVAESDQINTEIDTFLKGASVVATRYLSDGTCEVDVAINLRDLVVELTRLNNNLTYEARRRYNFNQVYNYHPGKTIQATGMGTSDGPVAPNNNYELQRLQEQNNQLLAENDQLKAQLARFKEEMNALQGNLTQLASLEAEKQNLLNQLRQLEQQINGERAARQRAEQEMAQLKSAYNKLLGDYRGLENQLNDLKSLRGEVNSLRGQLNNALNQLRQEQQKNANQNEQLNRLSAENNQLRNQNKQLSAELNALSHQNQQAEREIQKLRNQLASMQNSLQDINRLRKENDDLRQNVAALRQELDAINSKNLMLTSDGSRLQTENQNLRAENQALSAENDSLRAELDRLRRQANTPVVGDVWKNYPRGRLQAKRAAQLDAYRQIAENIKGLQISSSTSVQDFVAESDQINTALNTFIKGLRVVDVRYNQDLTCEVTVEVTLKQVIEELKSITKRYYRGGRWHDKTFNSIKTYYRRKVVSAVGSGTFNR